MCCPERQFVLSDVSESTEYVIEVTSLNGVSTLSNVYKHSQCNCVVFLPRFGIYWLQHDNEYSWNGSTHCTVTENMCLN